jgi:outer membrane protein assembly factor BamB
MVLCVKVKQAADKSFFRTHMLQWVSLGMERDLTELAGAARPAMDAALDQRALMPSTIAARVYEQRPHSLVRGVAMLPILFGCLSLAGGMGLIVTAPQTEGFATGVEAISPANVETIWEKQISPPLGNSFNLTLSLDNVLGAQDSESGRVLWTQNMPRIATTSTPLVFTEREKIYVTVATSDGAVYMLDGMTGQVSWMQNLSDQVLVSPLQIKNTVITVACADGIIYGLSASDGNISYMVRTDSKITALEPVADARGSQIYAIADKTRILAINAMTGDKLWMRDTAGEAIDSPIVSANRVITRTADGANSKLWAYDESGELSWMNTFNKFAVLASAEGYLALAQGNLITLIRAETGEPIHYWQVDDAPTDLKLVARHGKLVVKTDRENLVTAIN